MSAVQDMMRQEALEVLQELTNIVNDLTDYMPHDNEEIVRLYALRERLHVSYVEQYGEIR